MTSLRKALGDRSMDVFDATFDIGCNWTMPDPEDTTDACDLAISLMASKIEFMKEVDQSNLFGYDYRWIVADVTQFVHDNMGLFRDLARASGWRVTGDLDDDTEMALNMVSELVSGNADDGAYRMILEHGIMGGECLDRDAHTQPDRGLHRKIRTRPHGGPGVRPEPNLHSGGDPRPPGQPGGGEMTLPVPDVELTVSETEAVKLLDDDSEIFVDVEDMGDPYTKFLVKAGNRAETFYVVSVTAMCLKEVVREYRSAGYESEKTFRKAILESHPKVVDHSTLYCHRVAMCKCSNCRRYCDDYNPESVCADWNGRLRG